MEAQMLTNLDESDVGLDHRADVFDPMPGPGLVRFNGTRFEPETR